MNRKIRKNTIKPLKGGNKGFNKHYTTEDNGKLLTSTDVTMKQPIFYNNGDEIYGETSNNVGHKHKFIINSKTKEVLIFTAIHPKIKSIYHNHLYEGIWPDGYVTENKSNCWPDCDDGVELHNHELTKTINGLY